MIKKIYKTDVHINDYELLALQFDDNEPPKFNDNARNMKIDNQDFTIYYSNECPYVEYEVKELSDYAKEKKIPFNGHNVSLLVSRHFKSTNQTVTRS